jgi:hypothetical protein
MQVMKTECGGFFFFVESPEEVSFAVANMCCEDSLRAIMAEQVTRFRTVHRLRRHLTFFCSFTHSVACFHF